jgi:hypothetical protein
LKVGYYNDNKDEEEEDRGDWFHDAVHDMESLFWVLMYICLARRGPGAGMWRRELLPGSDVKDRRLSEIIFNNFDCKHEYIIQANKIKLFGEDNFMEEAIEKFHPYFRPLKSMMIQWWSVLRAAYIYRKIEYYTVHDQILGILDNAALKLHPESDEYASFTEKEIERRETVRNERLRLFRLGAEIGTKAADLHVFESPERAAFTQASSTRSNKFPPEPESPTPRHKKQRRELDISSAILSP